MDAVSDQPIATYHESSDGRERVLLLLEPLATQRNIRMVRDLAPSLPVIVADADLIAQALTNLVANAIKYSPADTEIVITARATTDTLLVTVKDHGYGIPAEVVPHIFEKFYRVPRATLPSGAGLGLTICRGIVAAHGGRMWAENRPSGGAAVRFTLPLTGTPPHMPPEDDTTADHQPVSSGC